MSKSPGVLAVEGRIEEVSSGEYYELITSDRRRATLEILVDRSEPMDLSDLAECVAEHEKEADEAATTKRTMIALHHIHLPKLADMGIVDYDSVAQRVIL